MRQYRVEVIPQAPAEAAEVLNRMAREGWRLAYAHATAVRASLLSEQALPALYVVLEADVAPGHLPAAGAGK
jgi:hypothetical protein